MQRKTSQEDVLKFHFSATLQASTIPRESNIHWALLSSPIATYKCSQSKLENLSLTLKEYSAYIQLPVTSEFYVREQISECIQTPKAVGALQGCI